MSVQPIKNSIDYEKYFSNELTSLLNGAVQEVARETLPSLYITPEIFFVGALGYPDCMMYKILNSYWTTYTIQNIYDMIYAHAKDINPISALRPNRVIEYSAEMRTLFQKANQERQLANAEYITSGDILLAALNTDTEVTKEIRTVFDKEALNYVTAKNLYENLKAVTAPLKDIDVSEFPFPDINNPSNVMSVDYGEGNDVESITIVGNIGDFTNPQEVFEKLKNVFSGESTKKEEKKQTKNNVKRAPNFCTNLVEKASKGDIDPIVGREEEIKSIIKIFNRRRCNNVILVGESGVGKTAIVEGLARQIADGVAPTSVAESEIYLLNTSDMMAGTQFRGTFEERLTNFVKEINMMNNAILFIDNIHNIFSDNKRNDYDFSGILSTLFSDQKVRVIATTTPRGFHATFEHDTELRSRFQRINVEKPTEEDCVKILKSNKQYYEQFHGVEYNDEAVKACVTLAGRYITDRNLPSSAIDILDEAGADKKIRSHEPEGVKELRQDIFNLKAEKDELIKADEIEAAKKIDKKIDKIKVEIAKMIDACKNPMNTIVVDVDDVYKTVAEHTNIPIQRINISEKKFLSNIDKILKKSIIGQDEAINTVSRAIKRNKVGLSPLNRPILSCLCIGSTGTGKTLLAKKLAQEIFGSEKYLVRFDMSEYADKTAVNKLIGASAGYVGYSEGGLLTEAIKNKKHAVLLIDEIEKADEEIFNLFLQILDEGRLTDNTGQKVDFRNTILVMTSNVGAKKAANEKGIGFVVDDSLNKRDIIEKELKNKFPPEFINRIDEIVYFNNLTDDNLKDIIRLELKNLSEKLEKIGNSLTYGDETIDYVFDIISKQREYGARPIIRTVQNEFENRITDLILENDYEKHDFVAKVEKGVLNIE